MGERYLHRVVAAGMVDGAFRALSYASRCLPITRPFFHGVEVESGIRYRSGDCPDHVLDVYRPVDAAGTMPVVLYVHGGGFRALSRETHWLMALAFARVGYLVFCIDYRLAPRHPYPAAIEDVCAAYRWVVEAAPAYGGDPSKLVVSGESAGANLVAALTICTAYERDEPWAREAWDAGVVPRAAVPACGIFQVSDSARFQRNPNLLRFYAEVIADVEDAYLDPTRDCPLADPLLVLERGGRPDRPLPPFFLPVGGGDPLAKDSIRLARALVAQGAEAETKIYPDEIHAFHAMVWRSAARQCWKDILGFASSKLADDPRPACSAGSA